MAPPPRLSLAATGTGLYIRNLRKSYRKRVVIRDVSLDLAQGEVVALLGPNGSGKTTVFYCIAGLVQPEGGQVIIDGRDVTALPMYRRAKLGIGYLPQEMSIFRGMSVEDNILAILEISTADRILRRERLEELLNDDRLLDGLTTATTAGAAALRDGLERAMARGMLLHVTVHRGEATEEWYMVNSPNGRELLEKLRGGELDLLADIAEDVQLQVERPTIFVLYEQNIGLLTPMIAEELRDAEKHFPADWIADAFREAVALNKRSWRYVLRILERWRVEGKDSGHARDEIPENSEARRRYYIPKGYEDLIEH